MNQYLVRSKVRPDGKMEAQDGCGEGRDKRKMSLGLR